MGTFPFPVLWQKISLPLWWVRMTLVMVSNFQTKHTHAQADNASSHQSVTVMRESDYQRLEAVKGFFRPELHYAVKLQLREGLAFPLVSQQNQN